MKNSIITKKLNAYLHTYFNLPKDIFFLFFARIINSMGNFVFPFLTLLLTQKLKLSKTIAGTLISISTILYIPGSLIGGKLADLYGRKKVFIISQFLFGFFIFIAGFFSSRFEIIYFIFIAILFNGAVSPALNGLVADLTMPEKRKQAYSLLYLGGNIGFAVGPLIAGFLFNKHSFLLFIGDSFTTLIAVLLALFFVKTPEMRNIETNNKKETIKFIDKFKIKSKINKKQTFIKDNTIKLLIKNHVLLLFSSGLIFYNFVYSQFQFSLPIQINTIFGEKGPSIYGFIMTTNALTVIIFTVILTLITLNNSSITNLLIAGFFYLIGFGALYFAKDLIFLIILTIIYTIGEILLVTNTSVFIMEHSPITYRSRFSSVIDIISGAGFALSPIFMGKIIDLFGISYVWIVCTLLMLIGILLIYITKLMSLKRN